MQLPGKRDCCWTTTADVTSFTNLKHSGKADVAIVAEPFDWPSPETLLDDDLFTAATVLFLQPARARRAKRALRIALGGEQFELLLDC
jgi:hypothetical protein